MQVPPKLTPREREIIPFLLSGATRNEIASTLGIAADTVKVHVKNLLDKFDASTVRDAFTVLNDYQKYYGVGGLGFDRFTIDISVEFEMLPGRRDAKITRKERVCAINAPLRGFKRRFYVEKGELDLSYSSPGVIVQEKTFFSERVVYWMRFEPQIEVGEVYDLTENIKISDHLDPQGDSDTVTWNVPFQRRKMIYRFPPNDPPEDIWYEFHLGSSQIILGSVNETRAADCLVLDFYEFQPHVTSVVKWHY